MTADAAMFEAPLLAVAGDEQALYDTIYHAFFARFPDRRAAFYNLAASGPRMVDETLRILHGLGAGERWVLPLVNELTFTHRNYGALPDAEYDAFVDIVIATLGAMAGPCWTDQAAAAWAAEATRLKAMIRAARAAWDKAMPGAIRAA